MHHHLASLSARHRVALRLAAALAIACTAPAWALEPADVAVIYNTNSRQSLELANYYVKARHIPEKNLIAIACVPKEVITEEAYRTQIVPQVKTALIDKNLEPTIKCLVTTYDVPLKIGAWEPNLPERQEITGYQNRLNAVLTELDNDITAYDQIAAPPPAATQESKEPATATQPKPKKITIEAVTPKLNAAASAAAKRLEALTEPERSPAMIAMIKLHERVAGIAGVLSDFKVKGEGPDAEKGWEQRNRAQARLQEIESLGAQLVKEREKPEARKKMVELQLAAHGLIGEVHLLHQLMDYLQPIESESCFDNELALVLADQLYPRRRWIDNHQNIATYSKSAQPNPHLRTLLVTRIDGSSVARTEQMIDRSLQIEKTGLDGKLYLDARGIHEGPYAVLDIEMRELAAWLKDNSTIEVVLDDKPPLFEAKDCPNAALYCGWYSLQNYQGSCQWVPGAVGYHVASGEMITLHTPGEHGWVVNLLDRGFCGTLGPTAEPYLSSFPNPAHFFPLILSGEFTQGEVWQVTAPMLSWHTGFVGDPLYNPFKTHPRVKLEALKQHPVLRNAFTILRPEIKLDPASQPASQPIPIVAPHEPTP